MALEEVVLQAPPNVADLRPLGTLTQLTLRRNRVATEFAFVHHLGVLTDLELTNLAHLTSVAMCANLI